MDDNGLEIVKLRKDFYKDSYRRLVLVVMVQVAVIVMMALLIGTMYKERPKPQYFATASDGRILPISPLNQNQYSDSMVLQWASDTVRKVFSYDYVNFPSHFESVSQSFTPYGWSQFQKAFKDSKTLERVKANKFVSTAVSTGVSSILRKGLISGSNDVRYAWKVKVPVMMILQNNSSDERYPYNVVVLVKRMSLVESPRGIGIDSFITETVN